MTKNELIAEIAARTELTKKDADKALKGLIEVISEELKKVKRSRFRGSEHLK